MDVREIETRHVLACIEPIWTTKTETASRVRGRIEAVLDWARVRGYRDGENPAEWRGHLDHVLPKRSAVAPVVHRKALAWREAPAYFARLRAADGLSARAAELMILTAARPGEAAGAFRAEFDAVAGLWTVPADRYKTGRAHTIPLSSAALALWNAIPIIGREVHLFPSPKRGRPITTAAILKAARAVSPEAEIDAHGFRSAFRDWAGDTGKPREVAEMALGHVLGAVESAYARSDLLDRRRVLMEQWAAFLTGGA